MRRKFLFLLLIVQCWIFAAYSNTYLFASVILILSAYWLLKDPKADPAGFTKPALVIALVTLVYTYFLPMSHKRGFFMYFLTYALAQFLLAVQCIYFRYRKSLWLDSLIPLGTTLVMLHSGNLYMYGKRHTAYALAVLIFGVSLVLFILASQPSIKKKWFSAPKKRALYLLFVIVLTIIMGLGFQKFGSRIDMFLLSLFGRISRFNFSTVAKPGQLTDKKLSYENAVTLRIISRETPGYMRGMAYASYKHPSWKVAGSVREIQKYDSTLRDWLQQTNQSVNTFQLGGEPEKGRDSLKVRHGWSVGNGMFTKLDTVMIRGLYPSIRVDKHGIATTRFFRGNAWYTLIQGKQKANLSPAMQKMMLMIPEKVSEEIREIARKLFEGKRGFREKMDAVIRYLAENHSYSLDATFPDGKNSVELFLTTKMGAHCEFFATGAALLLRLGGIPARYVTGYYVSEWNPYGEYWFATNRDAHAWVEAYDKEEGYVIVEATPPDGVPSAMQRGAFFYFMDAMRFDMKTAFLNLRLKGSTDLKEWALDGLEKTMNLMLSRTSVLLFLGVFAAVIVFSLRSRCRQIYPSDPYMRSFQELLAVMDRFVSKKGMKREISESADRFADRLVTSNLPDAKLLSEWYREYAKVRYSLNLSKDNLAFLRERENFIRKKRGRNKRPLS